MIGKAKQGRERRDLSITSYVINKYMYGTRMVEPITFTLEDTTGSTLSILLNLEKQSAKLINR